MCFHIFPYKSSKLENLLYNKKGDERYPDFKLYRMIAKTVHHCVPQDQLENPIFKQFILKDDKMKNKPFVMNIDDNIKNNEH